MSSQISNLLSLTDLITEPKPVRSIFLASCLVALSVGAASGQDLCDPCTVTLGPVPGVVSLPLTGWMVPADTDEILLVEAPQHGTWSAAVDTSGWHGTYTPSADFDGIGLDHVSVWIGTASGLDEGVRSLVIERATGPLVDLDVLEGLNQYSEIDGWTVVGTDPFVGGTFHAVASPGSTSARRSTSGGQGDQGSPNIYVNGSSDGPQPSNEDPDGDPFSLPMTHGLVSILKIGNIAKLELELELVSSQWTVKARAVADDGTFLCAADCATAWLDVENSADKTLRILAGPEVVGHPTLTAWRVYVAVEDSATGALVASAARSFELPDPAAPPSVGELELGTFDVQALAGPAHGQVAIRMNRAERSATALPIAQTLMHEDFEPRAENSESSAADGSILTEEGPFAASGGVYSLQGRSVMLVDVDHVFDLAQVDATSYPSGFAPSPQPYDRATLTDFTMSAAREVKMQFDLDTSTNMPLGTYMWVAEIGRWESQVNMGPARILMLAGQNGKRHFRIRAWQNNGTLVQSPWFEAASTIEKVSVHWAASQSGFAPNGFVRLRVGDRSIAVENLDNGNYQAEWAAVGDISHSYSVDGPSPGIPVGIDNLILSYF